MNVCAGPHQARLKKAEMFTFLTTRNPMDRQLFTNRTMAGPQLAVGTTLTLSGEERSEWVMICSIPVDSEAASFSVCRVLWVSFSTCWTTPIETEE